MVQAPKKPRQNAQPSLRDRAETLRTRMPNREADPVFSAIKDGRQLLEACRRARLLPATVEGARPAAENNATDDLFEHLRETIPQARPETAVGGIALAKYAVEVQKLMDMDLSEEIAQILMIIAEVRLA